MDYIQAVQLIESYMADNNIAFSECNNTERLTIESWYNQDDNTPIVIEKLLHNEHNYQEPQDLPTYFFDLELAILDIDNDEDIDNLLYSREEIIELAKIIEANPTIIYDR